MGNVLFVPQHAVKPTKSPSQALSLDILVEPSAQAVDLLFPVRCRTWFAESISGHIVSKSNDGIECLEEDVDLQNTCQDETLHSMFTVDNGVLYFASKATWELGGPCCQACVPFADSRIHRISPV